jgi:hypothetical protein
MTDDEAIRIAKHSPYGPGVVIIPNYSYQHPRAVIRVDLSTRPPSVERVDDPHPNLK